MAAIPVLFGKTVERALPLSKGSDLRLSIYDASGDPAVPFPPGTTGVIDIEYGETIVRFEAELVGDRLEFILDNEVTDAIPASSFKEKVSWRLRIGFADDPGVEVPVYEGPVYRGKHG